MSGTPATVRPLPTPEGTRLKETRADCGVRRQIAGRPRLIPRNASRNPLPYSDAPTPPSFPMLTSTDSPDEHAAAIEQAARLRLTRDPHYASHFQGVAAC